MGHQGSLQEAVSLRRELTKEWNSGNKPNLDKCGELLNRLKVKKSVTLTVIKRYMVDFC